MSVLIETRADFQQLAEERLSEAKVLLDAGKWSGAYYLAGYAVELALKACVIKMVMTTDAFPAKNLSKDCYVHDFKTLLVLLKLDDQTKADPDMAANWSVVRLWSEEKRYHRIPQPEAELFYLAITDAANGVLPWIKARW